MDSQTRQPRRVALARVAPVVLAALACAPATAAARPQGPTDITGADAGVQEGLTIREIRVSGLHRVREEQVRAHLASREGEPYGRDLVDADRRRLDALRWFSEIAITPRLEEDEVVIDIRVVETLRALILPAVGITDQDGVTFGAGLRAVNVGRRGGSLGATAKFGGATIVDVRFDRTTVTPGFWATTLWGTYRRAHNPIFQFDERSVEVIALAGWNATDRIRTGLKVSYLRMDSGSAEVALSPDGVDHLPGLGGFVEFDSLDSPSRPRRGWHVEVDTLWTFGDANSWSFTLDARRLQPIAARHVLALFAIATLQTGHVGAELPTYLQFGLGGMNSVRGWPLGARLGQNQAIATAEYQFEALPPRSFSVKGVNLYAGIRVAAFADVGLARSATTQTTAKSAIDGYGVGLRLFVPFVDLIRLDLAWGEPGAGARAYVGVNFKAERQRERVR